MSHSETVEQILDAAELLFAEKGFSEASLRLITGRAQVNLAAVNYHFGSKKALIEAVFARFLGPFSVALERELERYETRLQGAVTLEGLLGILVEQALNIRTRRREDLSIFMRLLGLALSEPQPGLRDYLASLYGRVFRRYMRLLQKVLPGIRPMDLFWRLHFMLGTVVFTLSGLKATQMLASERFEVAMPTTQVLKMMVAFLAAGLRAEVEVISPNRHPVDSPCISL